MRRLKLRAKTKTDAINEARGTFANGVTATEGQLKATVTGNGNTLNLNISGPGTFTQSSTDPDDAVPAWSRHRPDLLLPG
jgi:hypothetical protein